MDVHTIMQNMSPRDARTFTRKVMLLMREIEAQREWLDHCGDVYISILPRIMTLLKNEAVAHHAVCELYKLVFPTGFYPGVLTETYEDLRIFYEIKPQLPNWEERWQFYVLTKKKEDGSSLLCRS